jgi:hypothetical protein
MFFYDFLYSRLCNWSTWLNVRRPANAIRRSLISNFTDMWLKIHSTFHYICLFRFYGECGIPYLILGVQMIASLICGVCRMTSFNFEVYNTFSSICGVRFTFCLRRLRPEFGWNIHDLPVKMPRFQTHATQERKRYGDAGTCSVIVNWNSFTHTNLARIPSVANGLR